MYKGRSHKGVAQSYKLKLGVKHIHWQFEILETTSFPNLKRVLNIDDIQNKSMQTNLIFKRMMTDCSSYFHGVEYAKQFMWQQTQRWKSWIAQMTSKGFLKT